MLEEASYPDIHCYHSLVQLLVLWQMWRVQIASATTAKLINKPQLPVNFFKYCDLDCEHNGLISASLVLDVCFSGAGVC